MEQMSTELGERLRRERTRRKDRQADTAERFKISQPAYHRWESGENTPNDARFGDIAEYLGCEVEEVWRMAHDAAMPTSLEQMHQEVAALRRDLADMDEARREVTDLRAEVADLRNLVSVLTTAMAAIEEMDKRKAASKAATKAAPKAASKASRLTPR